MTYILNAKCAGQNINIKMLSNMIVMGKNVC